MQIIYSLIFLYFISNIILLIAVDKNTLKNKKGEKDFGFYFSSMMILMVGIIIFITIDPDDDN